MSRPSPPQPWIEDNNTTTHVPGAPGPMTDAPRRLALLVFHADGLEVVVLSPGVPVLLGRGGAADVRIADRSLSRVHARFLLGVNERVLVADLKSRNGTWVSGVAIDRTELAVGQEVLVGRVVVRVHALAPHEGAGGLGDEGNLREALIDAIAAASRSGERLAIAFVRAAAPLPSEDTHTVAPGDVSRWVHRVSAALGPKDYVARARRDAVLVLLRGADRHRARATVERMLQRQYAAEAALLAGVALFPEVTASPDKLIDRARTAADAAHEGQPIHVVLGEGAWGPDLAVPGQGPTFVSEAMRAAIALLDRASQARVPVVLFGETGTGKEVLARYLHERSPRASRPLVSVNCAAIPAQLVESTLFGHERGAFTGATTAQKGVFEAADGGTVFLDEIGELAPAAQAALLRVLETQRLTRVGSTREVSVDVRIVAATHRDLERMTQEGLFRADLFYRLATVVVRIPALRERHEDIAPLVRRFLSERGPAPQAAEPTIDPAALAALVAYPWPGNVRELKNAIERALVVAQDGRIDLGDLPERVREPRPPPPPDPQDEGPADPGLVALPPAGELDLRAEMSAHERRILVAMLEACEWNKTKAAERLGLPVRTLTYKMASLGIRRPDR